MAPTTKAPSPSRILFVDDDPDQLNLYARLFRGDLQIFTAPSGLHAFDIIRAEHLPETPLRVVVSDYSMPGINGIAFLDTIEKQFPEMGRVLLTGHADSELALEARRHKLLTKGMDSRLIRAAILREVRRHGG